MLEILFYIILAIIYGNLEANIEGDHPWAKALPTWRCNAFFNKILMGHPLTGYHLFMALMFILIFHFKFFIINFWSWQLELIHIGYLFLWLLLEDILWFVFNPYFGIKKFNKKHVKWHGKIWLLGFPIFYWFNLIFGIILITIGNIFK